MVVYKNLIIGLEPSRKIVDMRNSINISHNLKNAPNQWAQIMAEIIDKVDLLAKSLKLVRADAIDIDMEGQSALRIEVDKVRRKDQH